MAKQRDGIPAEAEIHRGPVVTTAFLISGFVIGALALLVDGKPTQALDLLVIAIGCGVLAAFRSRRPRGVAIWPDGMENRTGMFRRDRVHWGDVIRLDRENGAALVVHSTAEGSTQDRQIVVHGSDQLESYIGERDGASLEQPIRDALERYRQEHGEPRDDARCQSWSWNVVQLIELAVGLAIAIVLGVILFRAIDLLPTSLGGVAKQFAWVCAAVSACSPWAMVPGWVGPRFPKSLRAAVGWRSASNVMPYLLPWMFLLGARMAN
jgi:hypothetical protein